MRKLLLIVIATAVLPGLVALASFAAVMMAMTMGDWHENMMGGRGSDPSEETPVAGVTDVRIEDFAFVPANIVVDAGTTVSWTNEDGVDHTVTSDDGDELDSPLFGRGETYSHTFDSPGEYSYHCDPHLQMRGLVTVRAGTGS